MVQLPDDENIANKMIAVLKENKSIVVEEVDSHE